MSKLIRSMHVIAARRGDGLLPELAALLERPGPHSDVGAYSKVLTTSCAKPILERKNRSRARNLQS